MEATEYNKDENLHKAFSLQFLSVTAELIAIIISYRIFPDALDTWFIVAVCFISIRYTLYAVGTPNNYFLFFVIGNACSIINWMLYGLICSNLTQNSTLIAGILLTGMVAGAMIFVTYVKYLYIFYVTMTLGVFAISIVFKGGILTFSGVGIAILVIFLIFLSVDHYNLLQEYFSLLGTNSNLYLQQSVQTKKFAMLREQLDSNKTMRKEIEKKVVLSNDMLQKAIQQSILQDEYLEHEIKLIYEQATEGMLLVDEANDECWGNSSFFRIWDIELKEKLKKQYLLTKLPKLVKTEDALFYRNFPFSKFTNENVKQFGNVIINDCMLAVTLHVFLISGRLLNLWIFKDITEIVHKDKSIMNMVKYDSLTQLPARRLIHETLERLILEYQKRDEIFAIAFIDLDDFKMINDSMGHDAGNDVLKIFASRLKGVVRESDFVGRLSGDEFICIFTGLRYKSDIEPIIKKLRQVIEQEVIVQARVMTIKVSIGVSYYPCDASSLEELISYADIAMYRAKEQKGNVAYERFLPEYTQKINQVHELGQHLKSALIKKSFYLVYQPIYEVETGKVGKVEVLLRWREHVSPDIFIPLAEKLGLIQDIGLWVMQEACTACKIIEDMNIAPIKFCINISSRQIHNSNEITGLVSAAMASGCKLSNLEFELTESTLVDLDKAIFFIETLKNNGITVAIDDFGTGFSSLSYLKNLHFDSIKVDKAFVRKIFETERDRNLVEAVIELAHMLGAKITVEGVETTAQYEYFKHKGCHYIQGYLFSKPVEFSSLVKRVQSDHSLL